MAKKECSGCGSMLGGRTKECPDCGYKFLIKKRGPRPKEIDWTELKTGDIIKVVTGTGPYYLSKDKPGERIMMGEKGMFEVAEIIDSGPRNRGIYGHQLYGRSGKSHYREWIYMGESYYNDAYSLNKEPHRIKVLKKA